MTSYVAKPGTKLELTNFLFAISAENQHSVSKAPWQIKLKDFQWRRSQQGGKLISDAPEQTAMEKSSRHIRLPSACANTDIQEHTLSLVYYYYLLYLL